jgi:RimJ/RimL family protein N-acetyltransferase
VGKFFACRRAPSSCITSSGCSAEGRSKISSTAFQPRTSVRAGYSSEDALVWIAQCQKEIEAASAYDLGIFSARSDRLLGGISINQINKRYKLGNIGYWVRQSEQGNGFATEAVKLVIPYGFQVLGLNRLEIAILEANLASRKVAEKAGAVYEGIARNRLIKDGRPFDAAIYSLIPEGSAIA